MPGRFALFTDENVDGRLIKALVARGWDVVRAVGVGELAAAFERLAETDDPFAGYPIAYLE